MKVLFTIILLLCLQQITAREPIIHGQFDNFFMDGLGHFYTLHDNIITKYNSEGIEKARFSSSISGNISRIDVSNPLKILVFYNAFNQVLFLDNSLSPTSEPITLTNYGAITPTLAASAYDNGIWVFDHSSRQLKRLDYRLNITHQSAPVLLYTGTIEHFIRQSGEHIILAFDSTIMIFDKYASHKNTIPIPKTTVITWAPNSIMYIHQQTLTTYNYKTHNRKEHNWTYGNVKAIRYKNNQLYFLNNKGVSRATL